MVRLKYILAFLFLPSLLLANDMSGIAFLILFWPMEIVLCLLFIPMLVYCARALVRKSSGTRHVVIGIMLFLFSIAAGVLFPWLVSMNGAAQTHPGIVSVTVGPVIVLAVLTAVASLAVAVRARGKEGN